MGNDAGIYNGAAEMIAARFHEAYERLAPDFGYATREASAVPWAEVPKANRLLMTAVVSELLFVQKCIEVTFPGRRDQPAHGDNGAALWDARAAHRTAAAAADRFRDVLAECLGHAEENPGDDTLVAEVRSHFGRPGPEPTRWRDFLTGALAQVDQIRADRAALSASAEPEPLPADAPWPREECANRGPRIGEDGTLCRRSKGHRGEHRTSPSDGHGDVHWPNDSPASAEPEGGEGR